MARPKMRDQDRRSLRLSLRLTEAELEAVDKLAAELKLTRTAALMDAVEARLQEIEEFYRRRERE